MEWTELVKIFNDLPETSVGWHQHSNGGGWVEDSCSVDATSYIHEQSVVRNYSIVDNSTVRNYSTVDHSIVDHSTVDHWIVKRSPLMIFGLLFEANEVNSEMVKIGCKVLSIPDMRIRLKKENRKKST